MWNHNPYDERTTNKVEFEIYITTILFSRYISFLFHIQIDVFTFEVPVRQIKFLLTFLPCDRSGELYRPHDKPSNKHRHLN